jgi:hypothetical protein
MSKKVFILVPDGIGLRNFAFTKFLDVGKENGFKTVFWNNTIFNLTDLGKEEIRIQKSKLHPVTNLFKIAKIQIALNLFVKRYKDNVYDSYRFPLSNTNFKNKVKNALIKVIIKVFNSENGLITIGKLMDNFERKTSYYNACYKTLVTEKPSLVFCTNQRNVDAIAPLVAAKDLKIPTATFIFSWDNLPKATLIVETDYYFVWSDFMKKELLTYYPTIKESQICITGSTQFEPHYNSDLILSKEEFYQRYGLDHSRKYICFSGDDITTSPDDEQYLEDVAAAVLRLNGKGYNLGIIFRRCPVDFSNRYNRVLEKYENVIVPIDPLWEQNGESWNTAMPTAKDIQLQVNIIFNTIFVVNIGSSMVFDFATFSKPCFYINYNSKEKRNDKWDVKTIYNFVHFRSMPNKEAVLWLNSPDDIALAFEQLLQKNDSSTVANAQKWFEVINQHPPQDASVRIWNAMDEIIQNY